MAPASRTPSQASVLLTKRNHRGPHLLRTINGIDTSSAAPAKVSRPTQQSISEEDIFKPPENSSDDEDEDTRSNTSKSAKPPSQAQLKTYTTSLSLKRPAARSAGTRTFKRRKLQDIPDLPSDKPVDKAEASSDLFEEGMSQSQPKSSQRMKKYGRPKETISSHTAAAFKAPDAVPVISTHERPAAKALVAHTVAAAAAPTRNTKFKSFSIPAPPSSQPDSSAPSHLSSSNDGAGHADLPRSPTPLSDVDDCESSHSPSVQVKTNICPLCQKEVVRSRLKDPGMDIREVSYFSLRKQQEFCHEHTIADARVLFAEQEFPQIDWNRLKTRRIRKHNKVLKDIIFSKEPSHYLQQVDSQIPDKGSRKQVQTYIEKQRKEPLIPTGYYGAKGAQIMAEVIAQELSAFMNAKVAHEVIKCIGMGLFIANVLVPELTQRLVMEDMNINDAAKARTIMHESAHAGMILHPEDEKVERRDDD